MSAYRSQELQIRVSENHINYAGGWDWQVWDREWDVPVSFGHEQYVNDALSKALEARTQYLAREGAIQQLLDSLRSQRISDAASAPWIDPAIDFVRLKAALGHLQVY